MLGEHMTLSSPSGLVKFLLVDQPLYLFDVSRMLPTELLRNPTLDLKEEYFKYYGIQRCLCCPYIIVIVYDVSILMSMMYQWGTPNPLDDDTWFVCCIIHRS